MVVVLLAAYFISNVYEKWDASPVIIGQNAVATPINEIPFPAVTICNMNQARKSVVQKIKSGGYEELFLESLCSTRINNNQTKSKSTNWTQFRNFLLKVR